MRIARELAGYTMGEADLLRRAMGKKIASEMAKHRQNFIKGAMAKGVAEHTAETIFEQAAKFAGYGFNKGHAAAYAQVAYQTAYLKANYPVEFLAASMTLDIGNTDRLNIFRQEAARLGIASDSRPTSTAARPIFRCEVNEGNGVIYYALAAVKGVGRQAMDHVVAVRDAGGPFKSIADFARRIDPRLVNKRAFESLVARGRVRCVAREPPPARGIPPTSCWATPCAARATAKAGQASLFRRRRNCESNVAAGRR